jgi:hypothetical protein
VRDLALAGANVAKRRRARGGEKLAQDGGQARVRGIGIAIARPRVGARVRRGRARRRQLALQALDRAGEPIGLHRLEDVSSACCSNAATANSS